MPAVAAGFIDIPIAMYKKGVAVEIQFSPERLNDGGGDPNWIDLTRAEADQLLQTLQAGLAAHAAGTTAPLVVSLDQSAPVAESAQAGGVTAVSADDFKQWV